MKKEWELPAARRLVHAVTEKYQPIKTDFNLIEGTENTEVILISFQPL
jgi:hypothetical protein